MKVEWILRDCLVIELAANLNALSSEGWEILTVIPILDSWAGIVAKRAIQTKKGKKS